MVNLSFVWLGSRARHIVEMHGEKSVRTIDVLRRDVYYTVAQANVVCYCSLPVALCLLPGIQNATC